MENVKRLECPICHSHNVQVQLLTIQELKYHRHGLLWWVLIGWWWVIYKWLILTPFAMILRILRRRDRIVTKIENHKVCNDCGHNWK